MSLHYFDDMIVKSVMCIEKEWEHKVDVPFRGTYRAPRWILYFERRIARRDGYYIEDRVVRRDRCMNRYVPHGSRIERQQVCITRSDMYYYTWHCILLHYTYLSLVNLILCFVDLVIDFLRNLWLMNTELVIEDMYIVELLLLRVCNLLKCCYLGYVICWSVVIEDM